MRLNKLTPAEGSKHSSKRLGRGIGSGLGKTSGRGHKGQHARAGGYHKVGFEGGQMPLQRRLPKFGFTSKKALLTESIRLSTIEKIDAKTIDFEVLRSKGLINSRIKNVKVYLDAPLNKTVNLKGLRVTAGVKAAIESNGGQVE